MKKNLLKMALLMGATMVFAACGGGNSKDKLSMTPETTKITGPLSACFEVVDAECTVPLKDGKPDLFAVWNIKVRRTEAPLPFEQGVELTAYGTYRTDGQPYYNVGFGITISDENGNIIRTASATEGGMGGPYSSEDVTGLLALQPGDEGIIRWSVQNEEVNSEASSLKFKLASAFELQNGGGSVNTASSDEDIISLDLDEDSNDWDEFLDEYEEYVDSYIKLYKKAMAGDMDAMSEYADIASQAADLASKLETGRSVMTSQQVARYNKITNKMAKAAF